MRSGKVTATEYNYWRFLRRSARSSVISADRAETRVKEIFRREA